MTDYNEFKEIVVFKEDIKKQITELGVGLREDVGKLREEIGRQISKLRGDVGTEIGRQIGKLREELRGDVGAEIGRQISKLREDVGTEIGRQIGKLREDVGTEIDKLRRMLEILAEKISLLLPVRFNGEYFLDTFNRKVPPGSKELVSFYFFLKDLETENWKSDKFVNFTQNCKEFCWDTFGFPENHVLYVRNCYSKLMDIIKNEGVYLLSGSPGTGKTMFIIHHMKQMIQNCNSYKLVCLFNLLDVYLNIFF
jgi:predicted hydrocarbon binding protein